MQKWKKIRKRIQFRKMKLKNKNLYQIKIWKLRKITSLTNKIKVSKNI